MILAAPDLDVRAGEISAVSERRIGVTGCGDAFRQARDLGLNFCKRFHNGGLRSRPAQICCGVLYSQQGAGLRC
ncbi:hypothetical protein DP23_4384 [Ralstonia pickettii]|nr:hypothetical protein DP23_4384 [Ralstonia pickettii]